MNLKIEEFNRKPTYTGVPVSVPSPGPFFVNHHPYLLASHADSVIRTLKVWISESIGIDIGNRTIRTSNVAAAGTLLHDSPSVPIHYPY